MSILFYDAVAPKPYALSTLQQEGLGGSEATLIRIAEALHDTIVFQHNRASDDGRYTGALPDAASITHVICQRHPSFLPDLAKMYPKAKLYLWLHDWASPSFANAFEMLRTLRVHILTVSNTHKAQVQMTLAVVGSLADLPPIRVLYNPVDDSIQPDGTKVDTNKLLFFSSPHKGLDHAIKIFKNILSFNKECRLFVANPGYYPDTLGSSDHISILGPLPHAQVLSHVRSSLCVFHPNVVFPETFGIVHAEANAVGTPCLTHERNGATHEILDKRQMVDARNEKAVIERVLAWQKERPIVSLDTKFRLATIVPQWRTLLGMK